MTPYEEELLSQTKNKEYMAGIIFMDLNDANVEAWDLVKDLDIKIYLPIEARPILEKLAQQIIDKAL